MRRFRRRLRKKATSVRLVDAEGAGPKLNLLKAKATTNSSSRRHWPLPTTYGLTASPSRHHGAARSSCPPPSLSSLSRTLCPTQHGQAQHQDRLLSHALPITSSAVPPRPRQHAHSNKQTSPSLRFTFPALLLRRLPNPSAPSRSPSLSLAFHAFLLTLLESSATSAADGLGSAARIMNLCFIVNLSIWPMKSQSLCSYPRPVREEAAFVPTIEALQRASLVDSRE